jgi:hypothetical protein
MSRQCRGGNLVLVFDLGPIDATTTSRNGVNVHVQREVNGATRLQAEEILNDLLLNFRQERSDEGVGDIHASASGGSIHVNLEKSLTLDLKTHATGGRAYADIPATISFSNLALSI